MILAGILITLLGFVLALLSLTITSSVNGRLIIVLVGIAVSLGGILGVLAGAAISYAPRGKARIRDFLFSAKPIRAT